jgi:hypothetical protein
MEHASYQLSGDRIFKVGPEFLKKNVLWTPDLSHVAAIVVPLMSSAADLRIQGMFKNRPKICYKDFISHITAF